MPQKKRQRGPRGEGSVIELVDVQTGAVRYRIKIPTKDKFGRPGSPITKKMPPGTTEAAARREKRRMLQERDAGKLQHTAHETVGSLLKRWLAGLAVTGAQNTSTTYERLARLYLMPTLGHLPLSKLERKHVRALLEQIIRDGKQPTAATAQAALVRALDMAIDEELIVENVARLAKISSIVRSGGIVPHRPKQKRVPEAAHVAQLLDYLEPDPYGLVVSLMALHGLRLAEAMGLAYPRLDPATGTCRIAQNLTYSNGFQLGPTKTGVTRMVMVHEDMLARLAAWETATLVRRMARGRGAWLVEQPIFRVRPGFPDLSPDLIFTHDDGRPFLPESVRSAMTVACRYLSIPPILPHDLRHFVDTELARAQLDPETRRGVLGHESAAMDAVYVHTDTERLRLATAIMMDRLGKLG